MVRVIAYEISIRHERGRDVRQFDDGFTDLEECRMHSTLSEDSRDAESIRGRAIVEAQGDEVARSRPIGCETSKPMH